MRGSYKILNIRGINLHIHWTFLFLIGWVLLINANTGNNVEQITWSLLFLLAVSRMVRTLDPIYACIAGKDVPEVLNDFTSVYNINLLALLTHKHDLLERLFFKSTTRAMIFKTPIPLLILPDRYTNKTHNLISEKRTFL